MVSCTQELNVDATFDANFQLRALSSRRNFFASFSGPSSHDSLPSLTPQSSKHQVLVQITSLTSIPDSDSSRRNRQCLHPQREQSLLYVLMLHVESNEQIFFRLLAG